MIYPKEKSRTYFFWTEEWRKMIQGSSANLTNAPTTAEIPTIANETSGFVYTPPVGLPESPGAGVCATGQTAPCVPATTDPAKLALYAADNLTIGESFASAPGGKIPGNLLDKNAVLFMGTGAIPASNSTGPSGQPVVIASPKQPTYVREDVVRIDHDFSSKMHLMGHWIHDQLGLGDQAHVYHLAKSVERSFDQRERQPPCDDGACLAWRFHCTAGGLDADGVFPGCQQHRLAHARGPYGGALRHDLGDWILAVEKLLPELSASRRRLVDERQT
jgi:hypothetical protein